MRYLILALGLLIIGCESERNGQRCIGVLQDKKPGVEYELSVTNVVVGVIFSETVVVPVVVACNQLYCPIIIKEQK